MTRLPLAPAALLLAACTSTQPSPRPEDSSPAPTAAPSQQRTPAVSAQPSLTPVPGGSTAPSNAPVPGTTETEWGTIYDVLPAWYPLPHTAAAAEVRSGPVTGTFTIPATVEGTATTMQASLESAGYSTVAMSGPLEDGSVVIDSLGEPGCRVQTTLAPAGDATLLTVLVDATCPPS